MSSASAAQATGTPLVTLTTTAETAAITSNALAVNAPGGEGVLIQGTVTGATGAGVTSCQVRIRQGANTTTGTVVGAVMQEAQGASSFYSMAFSVLDTSVGTAANPSGTAQYTVTVQQVGATGNGTVTLASVAVEAANLGGT